MPKSENQKLKLLYIRKYLLEQTDDSHGLTVAEIIGKLESDGIRADRKTIYTDLEELGNFGMDIISEKSGRNTFYHLASRDFELPELKLLVDSVQSAKFITERKSNELIRKLETLVSIHEAKQLQRQVLISGRVKGSNEKIYYNVDTLHAAIAGNVQITFQYFQWNAHKEMVLRHDGAVYQVSPWTLAWDDENYYLIAYDQGSRSIRHYRVDKMLNITLTEKTREGREEFEKKDASRYTKKLFGMFGGDPAWVTIEAANELAGVFIDRFGQDIMLIPTDGGHFKCAVEVETSDHFLSWIIALGEKAKITGPPFVVEKMRRIAQTLISQYG